MLLQYTELLNDQAGSLTVAVLKATLGRRQGIYFQSPVVFRFILAPYRLSCVQLTREMRQSEKREVERKIGVVWLSVCNRLRVRETRTVARGIQNRDLKRFFRVHPAEFKGSGLVRWQSDWRHDITGSNLCSGAKYIFRVQVKGTSAFRLLALFATSLASAERRLTAIHCVYVVTPLGERVVRGCSLQHGVRIHPSSAKSATFQPTDNEHSDVNMLEETL